MPNVEVELSQTVPDGDKKSTSSLSKFELPTTEITTFEMSASQTPRFVDASKTANLKSDVFFDGMGPIEKVEKWRQSQQKLRIDEVKKSAAGTAATGANSNLPSCYGSCPTRQVGLCIFLTSCLDS
jgi:hypothetical protein